MTDILEQCERQKKRIAELEEQISVLLSCQNCPGNKGGLLCQKEYEDKCLAQKIQYIKELKEENADLGAQIEKMKCCENCIHYDKDLGCMEVLKNCQCLSEWKLRR